MMLREKGKKDAEPVAMGWDEAQAALQAGAYEIASEVAETEDTSRGPDQPAAQSPSPGTEPSGASEKPDFDAMTRAELDALAAERNLDVSQARTKADVIKVLTEAA